MIKITSKLTPAQSQRLRRAAARNWESGEDDRAFAKSSEGKCCYYAVNINKEVSEHEVARAMMRAVGRCFEYQIIE